MARKKKRIRMARSLSFSTDVITETFGFMARRKGGKTYSAQKLAEEMMDVGAQIVVLDPIGNWWALRLEADGKTPAYDIPLLGGLRGDIPLSPDSGSLIADTVVNSGTSVVLDVSQLSKKGQRRFVAEFCERLFRRRQADPAPTHVFFEEAHSFCPQRFEAGDARMVGAVEDIVRKGRNFGLGATMISQRPQSVNKETFNQVECLFMLKTNGPHERKALRDWVDYKGVDAKKLIGELPTLRVGEAWVSSPELLAVPIKVTIEPKHTFDASAAPKLGARGKAKQLRKLDLAKLEEAMSTVIAEADANDPSKLRARVAELERELAAPVEVASLADLAERDAKILDLHERLRAAIAVVHETVSTGQALEDALLEAQAVASPGAAPSPAPRGTKYAKTKAAAPSKTSSKASPPANRQIVDNVNRPEQEILDSIAWWESYGIEEPSRVSVAFLAKVGRKSSGFRNKLSKLRTAGLLDYAGGSCVRLTGPGRAAAHYPDRPANAAALQRMVLDRLSAPQADVLSVMIEDYPDSPLRADVGERAGKSPTSSGLRNIFSTLVSLGFAEYPDGDRIRASALLFKR